MDYATLFTGFGTAMCLKYTRDSYGPLEVFITRDECNEFVAINYVAVGIVVTIVAVGIVVAIKIASKNNKKG